METKNPRDKNSPSPYRTYKRNYKLMPLAGVLPSCTSEAFAKRGFAEQRILQDWEQIVGAVLAEYCHPKRLTFPPQEKAHGTLTVSVSNPGIALELQHYTAHIIEKIATFYGYRAVAQIRIMQEPLTAKKQKANLFDRSKTDAKDLAREESLDHVAHFPAEASVETIADEQLKATLTRLGKRIALQQENRKMPQKKEAH